MLYEAGKTGQTVQEIVIEKGQTYVLEALDVPVDTA
jgi:hypothetical protein